MMLQEKIKGVEKMTITGDIMNHRGYTKTWACKN